MENELPQKTSHWTPVRIFSVVLLSTSSLLFLRFIFNTTLASKEFLFPYTLMIIGLVMSNIIDMEKRIKQNRIAGIAMLAIMIFLFLSLVVTYLIASH